MSLINKMLKDLDARGQKPGAGPTLASVKLAAMEERTLPSPRQIGALVALGLALAYATWMGLNFYKARVAKPVALKPRQFTAGPPPKPAAAPVPAPALGSAPAPAPVAAPAVSAAAEASVPAKPAAASAAASMPSASAVKAKSVEVASAMAKKDETLPAGDTGKSAKVAKDEAPASASADASVPHKHKHKKAAASEAASVDPALAAVMEGAKTSSKKKRSKASKSASASKSAASQATEGREMSAAQRAESIYGKALAALPEGRNQEAISLLEQAVQLDPQHEAARQMLVRLLLESHRTEEAMRQLQNSLSLDARQPDLAMLLARLQIEGGQSGVETLLRSAPYASGNGDYFALLGGALAREQRHTEAADAYRTALRSSPSNGVWWMGLGLSLQASKQNAEAIEAYQKARTGSKMTPELRAFVDRKLAQLGR